MNYSTIRLSGIIENPNIWKITKFNLLTYFDLTKISYAKSFFLIISKALTRTQVLLKIRAYELAGLANNLILFWQATKLSKSEIISALTCRG